jgi:ubiquinol-cytochrome c reductase cytochrome b subunit
LTVGGQYVLTAHDRLPELEEPVETDAHGVPAPNGRKEKLRARFRRFYYDGAVDKPTAHDVEHAAEHFGDHDGHPVLLGEDFQGISEVGVPKKH